MTGSKEKEIFSVNPSKKFLNLSIIGLVLVGLIVFLIFDALDIPEALEFLPGEIIWVSLAPLIVIGLVIMVIIFDWQNKKYILTTKRVEMVAGIISKSEKSIANNHIEVVKYNKPYWSSLFRFNCGNVIIYSAGHDESLIFTNIESPKQRADQIEEQIRLYRSRQHN